MVCQSTVTVEGVAGPLDREHRGVTPELPSATLRLPIVRNGSSSEIVTEPLGVWIVALGAFDRSTVKVSSVSGLRSPFTSTVMVPELWLGGIASVPDAGW